MASGDSKVTVRIEGDADGLGRELKKADKGIAGLSASTKGLSMSKIHRNCHA